MAFLATLATLTTITLIFILPLSWLLMIQSLNYLNGQTTGARFKYNSIQKEVMRKKFSGLQMLEHDGQSYARDALLNAEDY